MIVRVEVRGMVQGVGFRWFARERARRLGLTGWVRNRGDGAVEIAASGSDAAIAEFIASLSQGPPGARVDGVVRLGTDGLGPLDEDFTVMR